MLSQKTKEYILKKVQDVIDAGFGTVLIDIKEGGVVEVKKTDVDRKERVPI